MRTNRPSLPRIVVSPQKQALHTRQDSAVFLLSVSDRLLDFEAWKILFKDFFEWGKKTVLDQVFQSCVELPYWHLYPSNTPHTSQPVPFLYEKKGLTGYCKLLCMLYCSNTVVYSVRLWTSSIGYHLKSSNMFGSRDLELYFGEEKLYCTTYAPSDGLQYRNAPLAAGTLTHRTCCTHLLKFLHSSNYKSLL